MPQIDMDEAEDSPPSLTISDQKKALAEARAGSGLRGHYCTADATLCSSVVFSLCFAKTM